MRDMPKKLELRNVIGWGGVLLALVGPLGAQTTYTTTSPAAAIPDNSGGVFTACQTITVPAATGLITDVDVRVATAHSWVGDLTYRLVSPAPSTLMVMNRPGRIGSGAGNPANFAAATPITFNDTAASGRSAEDIGEDPVNTACLSTAIVGSTCGPDNYIPAPDATDTPIAGLGTNLAQFNGVDPAGVWTLCAADSAVADTGTLTSWSLIVTTVAPACTLDLTCPGNVTANAPPGALSVGVNFPAPTFTGTCTSPTITCVPASGSAFPIGTTTVVCTGIEAQTVDTCSFDVTVNEGIIQNIPTASTFGLALLALLIAGAAFVALRRAG